ncbi:MAG: hypothetical protein AAF415_12350 [Pseudomonadota bacterium]
MADVIKIALQRRAELSAELSRLDDFIRMAESLVQDQGSSAPQAAAEQPRAEQSRAERNRADVVDTVDDADGPAQSLRSGSGGRPTVFRQKANG